MAFAHLSVIVTLLHIVPSLCGGMMRRDASHGSGLRPALEKILAKDVAKRLFAIEEILRPTFESFPKNSAGKIVLQSLHSMARGYFAEEHGWLFTGFEFTGPRSTRLSDANLLKDKAKDVVTALEKAQSLDEGLSLSDTVASVAAMEHLVLEEEIIPLLHRAYELKGVSTRTAIEKSALEALLQTFLMVFRAGKLIKTPADLEVYKAELQKTKDLDRLSKLCQEVIQGQTQQAQYSLGDIEGMVKELALRYGKWQDSECIEMKQALMRLDTDGSGRVRLQSFHAEPKSDHYAFTESQEELRNFSVLDETSAADPRVLTANYLVSPSNCVAWSKYFSVCCLSACENIINQLEAIVHTSDVPVQTLLDATASLASASVQAPRELPTHLVDMAKAVAAVHGGIVSLQSGDFRRWIHFAYPNECPYPTDLEALVAEGERDASERFASGVVTEM